MNPGGLTQLFRTLAQVTFVLLLLLAGYLSTLSFNSAVVANAKYFCLVAALWSLPTIRVGISWAASMANAETRAHVWFGGLMGPFFVGFALLVLLGATAAGSASDARMILMVLAVFPFFSLNPKWRSVDGKTRSLRISRVFGAKHRSLEGHELTILPIHLRAKRRGTTVYSVAAVTGVEKSQGTELTPRSEDEKRVRRWIKRIHEKTGLPMQHAK
ncbi:MAG: hypothetical protein AB8H86_29495 [Polyangiales bacterium]